MYKKVQKACTCRVVVFPIFAVLVAVAVFVVVTQAPYANVDRALRCTFIILNTWKSPLLGYKTNHLMAGLSENYFKLVMKYSESKINCFSWIKCLLFIVSCLMLYKFLILLVFNGKRTQCSLMFSLCRR